MHRGFSSSYTAKFVSEKDRMYVENANRAANDGFITVDNLEPNPKNPIIAAFFRNIGYADQLGSGVRNLFKYSKYYSGQEPKFIEGDVFRIIVPLDDEYSYDFGSMKAANSISGTNQAAHESENADKVPTNADKWFVGTAGAENLGITVCLDVIFYFVNFIDFYASKK